MCTRMRASEEIKAGQHSRGLQAVQLCSVKGAVTRQWVGRCVWRMFVFGLHLCV